MKSPAAREYSLWCPVYGTATRRTSLLKALETRAHLQMSLATLP